MVIVGDVPVKEPIDPQTIELLKAAFEEHPEFARILLAVVTNADSGDEYRMYDVSIGNSMDKIDR